MHVQMVQCVMKSNLLLLSTLLAALLLVSLPLSSEVIAAKDPLSLRTQQGDIASLDEYVGENNDNKWLLVMIWSTDCSVCFKEMPGISDFHQRHKGSDANVIGIALDGFDNREMVSLFATKNALSFPNLLAEMPAFALRYEFEVGERLLGTPTYLLFNPAGELVANNPGPLRPVAIEQFMAR